MIDSRVPFSRTTGSILREDVLPSAVALGLWVLHGYLQRPLLPPQLDELLALVAAQALARTSSTSASAQPSP